MLWVWVLCNRVELEREWCGSMRREEFPFDRVYEYGRLGIRSVSRIGGLLGVPPGTLYGWLKDGIFRERWDTELERGLGEAYAVVLGRMWGALEDPLQVVSAGRVLLKELGTGVPREVESHASVEIVVGDDEYMTWRSRRDRSLVGRVGRVAFAGGRRALGEGVDDGEE